MLLEAGGVFIGVDKSAGEGKLGDISDGLSTSVDASGEGTAMEDISGVSVAMLDKPDECPTSYNDV